MALCCCWRIPHIHIAPRSAHMSRLTFCASISSLTNSGFPGSNIKAASLLFTVTSRKALSANLSRLVSSAKGSAAEAVRLFDKLTAQNHRAPGAHASICACSLDDEACVVDSANKAMLMNVVKVRSCLLATTKFTRLIFRLPKEATPLRLGCVIWTKSLHVRQLRPKPPR